MDHNPETLQLFLRKNTTANVLQRNFIDLKYFLFEDIGVPELILESSEIYFINLLNYIGINPSIGLELSLITLLETISILLTFLC